MEINEEKLKGVLTEQREEYQRQLGVAMEDLDSKISTIAEQYTDIKTTLSHHSEILTYHTEQIGYLSTLSMNVEIIKTDIEFIKNSLKKKIDVEEFAALEKRVALLEGRAKR